MANDFTGENQSQLCPLWADPALSRCSGTSGEDPPCALEEKKEQDTGGVAGQEKVREA